MASTSFRMRRARGSRVAKAASSGSVRADIIQLSRVSTARCSSATDSSMSPKLPRTAARDQYGTYLVAERCNRIIISYAGRSSAFETETLAHRRVVRRRIHRLKDILRLLDQEAAGTLAGAPAPAGASLPPTVGAWAPPLS